MDSTSPFACLLVGQPTLRRRIKLGAFAALDQRIALRYAMPADDRGGDQQLPRATTSNSPAARDTLFSDDAADADPPNQPRLPSGGEQPRCATRRLVVSPAQLGGTWREVPGSDGLPGLRKVKGTVACQKTSGRVQAYGSEALRDPRDMAKAGLPESQSPDDAR